MGAAGGGLLGHEIGGGSLGTLGGALAGAIGANALEKRHERHKHSRRASSSDNRRDREDSPGGLRGAISGFLHPHGGDERRSRSSYGERRRKDRGGSVSEDEEISIRRGGERWR